MKELNRLNRRAFFDRVGLAGVAVGLAATALPDARQATGAALTGPPSKPQADATTDPERDLLKWPKPAKDRAGEPFPSQDPALVQEVVAVSHGNLERVTQLVEQQPALAKAAWDWGFGDWESALGAASHVGHRAIAELLLKHGAAPTIFSAAMLGQLDAVRAFIAASPGIERQRGPHGITLLAHARAGREPAAAVVAYLVQLGTADDRLAAAPLDAADRAALAGRYTFGPGPRDAFIVDEERNALGVRRLGATRRGLLHRGALEFSPVGADAVRLRFVRDASASSRDANGAAGASVIASLTIAGLSAPDGASTITARKV